MTEPNPQSVRVAFVGLATSHPFVDVAERRLREPSLQLMVWEPDPVRLERFVQQNPEVVVVGSLEAIVAGAPNIAIVTVRPGAVNAITERLLDAGVPVMVNKLAAVTAEQLDELDRVLEGREHQFLTSSVLRFAPSFAGAPIRRSELLSVRVTIRHDVSWWIGGETSWQDDPRAGGGTIGIMGVHAFELLDSLVGPGFTVRWVHASRRHLPELASEDTALIGVDWPDGLAGVIEVLGHSETEEYSVAAHYATETSVIVLKRDTPAIDIDLGYAGMARAVLSMAYGEPSPVPWARSRAVLTAVIAAR